MQVPVFRIQRSLKDGREETRYEISWFPIVVSVFAATGTFGNFILQVGIRAHWW
jgi:hypothetical protein